MFVAAEDKQLTCNNTIHNGLEQCGWNGTEDGQPLL